MEFHKDNSEFEWTREDPPEAKKPFDFDDFLDPDDTNLDDRVTELLGGRELLEPDAFGGDAPKFVPGRYVDGERGRHEAPSPETEEAGEPDEAPETEEEPEETMEPPPRPPRIDPDDPRYAAPERPRIVVAEPRAKIYVTPPTGEEYNDEPEERGGGMGEALKWILAALVVLAILGGVFIKLMGGSLGSIGSLVSNLHLSGGTRPAVSETLDQTAQRPADPTPTPLPQATTYTITVTAGSGGSVSPSGAVAVKEGESVTFSIIPKDGYQLSQLLVDGGAVTAAANYTFSDVTANHTIYAVFQELPAPTAEPTPEPTPEPTAEPTPEPTPEPLPEITPEPLPEVTPEPVVETEPEPPADAAEPEAVPEPIPEPAEELPPVEG